MKKLRVSRGIILTFEEGCNRYLENCRQRRYISSAKRIYAEQLQKADTPPDQIGNGVSAFF